MQLVVLLVIYVYMDLKQLGKAIRGDGVVDSNLHPPPSWKPTTIYTVGNRIKTECLWFNGGVAGSLPFFAWEDYATNVGKSRPVFKVEVTKNVQLYF